MTFAKVIMWLRIGWPIATVVVKALDDGKITKEEVGQIVDKVKDAIA